MDVEIPAGGDDDNSSPIHPALASISGRRANLDVEA